MMHRRLLFVSDGLAFCLGSQLQNLQVSTLLSVPFSHRNFGSGTVKIALLRGLIARLKSEHLNRHFHFHWEIVV